MHKGNYFHYEIDKVLSLLEQSLNYKDKNFSKLYGEITLLDETRNQSYADYLDTNLVDLLKIMNDKLIEEMLKDYTLRDLQVYSSVILSEHNATNNFIKQFKADHDSHQFYKNVIKWYIKEYQKFPDV